MNSGEADHRTSMVPGAASDTAADGVHIRDYRSTDRGGVLALRRGADRDLNASVPRDFYADLDEIEETYVGGAFLVAESAGRVVGMGGLLPTGEVVRMRVDGALRRRGIARRILEALLDRAHGLGLDRVFLHTSTEQKAAQQLYVAAGFRESGRGEVHGNAVIAYEVRLSNIGP